MCGIVGIYNYTADEPVNPALLRHMRDSMAHRGPDGAGLWISSDHRVGLAHRRLSIIDLSDQASQPMSNQDDTVWIVFNGEIYNHATLRAELETRGRHHWKTDHSDTEVILHAYEEWGVDCLARFRGMFAFALYDDRLRQLWLVRDRLGIKPLYYSIQQGRISFASEIKALLCDPGQRRAVHEEALYHYLTFMATPPPQTLFEGIQKLPAGCWMIVSAEGQIQHRRYWDALENRAQLDSVSDEAIASQLLAELRTAVTLRKVSDVPVGTFLSGGIDSSTNTALFSEDETHPINTFSIGYDNQYGSYPSELPYARLMAQQVGADYHERILNSQDLIDFLPQMVYLQDEPVADSVCVPVYYLARLARDHGVIVCQVGEGADELYWGYESWKLWLRLQQINDLPVPRQLKQLGLWGLKQLKRDDRSSYEWLRRVVSDQPVFWGGSLALHETVKHRLLSPRMRSQFARMTSWEALAPIYQRYQASSEPGSYLTWMSYLDLNLRLPELLLMRVDKMCMGVGVEARVPFLDHRFVEFSMAIPEAVKTRYGILKYILKKAVRGLVPDVLIDRRKQGFGVPVYEWFRGSLGDVMRQELDAFCRETDFLDPAAVTHFIAEGIGPQVWYLLNLALWWKTYVAQIPEPLVFREEHYA